MIELFVRGHPATQGSKKAFKRGKKIVLVEMDPKLPAWREQILNTAIAYLEQNYTPLDGHLEVRVTFWLPAPQKSSFGDRPAGPPDLDKLQRALGDGLAQAGVIKDDARITRWDADKRWTMGGQPYPGATVRITHRGETP